MHKETKSKLLKVTRDLIDSRGLEAVSMREVGRCAGLSRAAAYRHFKNKQSLLAAIVVEDFGIMLKEIRELESRSLSPKAFLVGFLNDYYDFAIKNPDHYHLMYNTSWDEHEFPEVMNAAVLVFQKMAAYVAKALDAEEADLIAIRETTAMVYSFIHGLSELHLAGHKEASKGLDNPANLIDRFIKSAFCQK